MIRKYRRPEFRRSMAPSLKWKTCRDCGTAKVTEEEMSTTPILCGQCKRGRAKKTKKRAKE